MLDAFALLWVIIPIIIGYIVGTIFERQHYASIRQREQDMLNKAMVFNIRTVPPMDGAPQLRLVAGGTVVSVDAFKRLAAMLHSFFGGQVTSYESLLDRGRREAILRMREKAHNLGATMIFGVRLETTTINNGDPRLTTGIELVAYGTAVIPDHTVASASPWGSGA